MKSSSRANDLIQELDIAEGLRQSLMDAHFTIESILDLGYRGVSELLQIDLYVRKIIVEAAQHTIEERNPGQDLT